MDISGNYAHFKIGMLLEKISDNKYFNCGEIIECVDIIDNVPYFTSKRLRSIHQKHYLSGEHKAKGIPLDNDECFTIVDDNSLLLKIELDSLSKLMQEKEGLNNRRADIAEQLQKLIAEKQKVEEAVVSINKALIVKHISIENIEQRLK